MTNTLRRDLTTFVGREAELARIVGAAEPVRRVSIHTIDGMPGVGKTALVTRAAHRLAPDFPDGQYFVELHAHTPGQTPAEPLDVLAGLLTDLGVDPRFLPPTLEGRRDLWLDRMSCKRVLLVLDDARDHAQIEPLLPAGGRCLTLVTSRQRLTALDGAAAVPLDVLDSDTAAELFVTLARRSPADLDPAAVGTIVRLCGFLPLAIVLLAARLAQHPRWTITGLADELGLAMDRLDELQAGPRAVRATFTMSYQDLQPERQRLFRLLGLHPGPDIDIPAAAALADIDIPLARTELEALYIDHLIDETQPRRYRLHDLLREYVRVLAAAEPADTRSRAVDRLLDYYQTTAAAADRHMNRRTKSRPATTTRAGAVQAFADEADALAWMRTERDNLLACLDYTATRQAHRALDLTDRLANLLERDGTWPHAADLHQRALATAQHLGDRPGEAAALTNLGRIRELTGDHADATDLYRQALLTFREVGDRLGEANTRTNLGIVRRLTGDYADAAALHRQALQSFRSLGDRLGEANTLTNLGTVCELTGDRISARDLHHQALALHRELGNQHGQANTLGNLGNVHLLTGDPDAAVELQQQALTLFRKLGNRLGEANTLGNLGLVRQSTGDYASAADLQQQALTLFYELGNRLGQANTLDNLGLVRQSTGDYASAADLHQQALLLHRKLGNRLGEANALDNLGLVRQLSGDYTGAAELHQEALLRHRELGNQRGEAEVLNEIGDLLLKIGELPNALERFTEALAVARSIDSQLEQAHALEGAARCRVGLGDTATAITELQHAVETFRRIGAPEADVAATYLATLNHNAPPS